MSPTRRANELRDAVLSSGGVSPTDAADFDKPIYDLDMDSLDVVDLSQALEKEFGVKPTWTASPTA